MQELNKEQEQEEEEEGEEEEDQEVERTIGQDDLFVTDYEKARLERIQENSAKLAALNLPSLASSIKQAKEKPKHEEDKKQRRRRRTGVSLPCSSRAMPERQCKSSIKEDNEEEEEEGEEEEEREYGDCSSDYQPSDVDGYSSSDEEEREKEEGYKRERAYQVAHGDDEDDLELQQALALSLGESIEDILPKNKDNMETNEMESLGNKKGDKKQRADASKRKARNRASSEPDLVVDQRKKKKRNWREIQQFTEDEINNLFILFGGNKRGRFSIHELEEIALSHDFMWNKKELADMIDIFDYDKDGKINLDEFRGIIVRCNMVKP